MVAHTSARRREGANWEQTIYLAVSTQNPGLGKKFLPGLLAENRDGNGSLPRFRNLISVMISSRPSTFRDEDERISIMAQSRRLH